MNCNECTISCSGSVIIIGGYDTYAEYIDATTSCTLAISQSHDAHFAKNIYFESMRWDRKAFQKEPWWHCRRAMMSVASLSVEIYRKYFNRIIRPRRAFSRGVRYALCDTRVI